MPSTFYPFHYLFHDKFQFIWFYCDPFSLPWTNKSMGLSLPTSLAYIKWSQPSTTHFGKNAILVRHFPKKGPGWKSKIGFFPLPSNYTLCKSLDRPTSHALTRYWLMVLRPQHGFSTTLCFLLFFFSFPHRFYHSTLFHFTPCSFCPCLSFMEGWHGLLGLNILLSFHGPVGLLAAISCRACLLGLVPFFLSFQAFAARYSYFVSLLSFLVPVAYILLFQTRLAYCALSFFLLLFFFPELLWSLLLVLVGLLATISCELVHWDLFISFFSSFYSPFAFVLLSNLLPLFFFACHWVFLLLGPFCKKRVSTMLYNTKKVTCLLTTNSTSSLSSKAIIV